MGFLGFPAWLWGLLMLWWLIGVASFPIISLLAAPSLPAKWRKPFGIIYVKLGMLALDRAMLVQRRDGSYSLLPSRYDPESEAEVVEIDGHEREFTDTGGLMGSLARRKLGIALENVQAVLNPAVVAVAEAQGDKLANGEGFVEAKVSDGGEELPADVDPDELDDEELAELVETGVVETEALSAYWDTDDPKDLDRGGWVVAMNPYTRLKNSWVAVDMREIWNILEGSADSDLGRRTQQRTLASQAHRQTDKTLKIIGIGLGALITGWVLRDLSVSGGGGGAQPVINMPFTVMPGWALDVLAGGLL